MPRPPELRKRTLAALALSPMTRHSLAMALGAHPQSMSKIITALCQERRIHAVGKERNSEHFRHAYLYGLCHG